MHNEKRTQGSARDPAKKYLKIYENIGNYRKLQETYRRFIRNHEKILENIGKSRKKWKNVVFLCFLCIFC